MKAADIPDATFLDVVRRLNTDVSRNREYMGMELRPPHPAMLWQVTELLAMPEKVVRAKARKLIARGLLDGCPCGCRGDFMAL